MSSPAEIFAVYLIYKIVIQRLTIQSQLSKQLINRGLKVKSNSAITRTNRFAAKSMNTVSCPGVVNSGDISQRD